VRAGDKSFGALAKKDELFENLITEKEKDHV
jgi:hypothetical protein